ncbi:MAG: AAA family ATPase, partial [Sneathiella sp.]|nr:AAA family ATPase [Sneathiella sp.]
KGIGTPATRAAVITGLKRQNFITQSGKHIVPTPSGLTLYKTLKATAPELVDPGVTALWEMKLDDVLVGKQTARQVWDEIGNATSRLISVIRDNAAKAPKITTGVAAPKGSTKFGTGKPTDKMIATAKSIADRKGLKLPKKYDADFQVCKDFLDEHLGGNPLIAIEKRLGSGLIKGLGPTAAKTLVTAFGTDTYKIIEETPERLSEVKGIGPKIVKAAIEKKIVREIGNLLHSHGVVPEFGLRLHKIFGEEAVNIIAEDPYRIIRHVKQFGFENCDRIAHSIGLKQDDPARAQAAMFHTLDQATGPWLRAKLIKKMQIRLDIPADQLEHALDAEIKDKILRENTINDQRYVSLDTMMPARKTIPKILQSLSKNPSPWPQMDTMKAIEWVNSQLPSPLTTEQQSAVSAVLNTESMFLSVAHGVNSTPVIKAIQLILRAKGIVVKLGTSTHAGALSLKDQGEEDAEPLARMLGWQSASNKFKHTSKKPLDCQLLIIDAVHAVDQNLLSATLQALPKDTGLLMIGTTPNASLTDTGELLTDLVASGKITALQLTETEQALHGSQRLKALRNLSSENSFAPDTSQPIGSDFFQVPAKFSSEAIAKTVEIVSNRLPSKFNFDAIADIQVICPSTTGELGSIALNNQLQQVLNPIKDPLSINRFGWRYRVNDKVIMLGDDFEKGLTRNEIGRIKKIDTESQTMRLTFADRGVDFQFDELDILTLAYAISTHMANKLKSRATVTLKGTTDFNRQAATGLSAAQELAVIIG